MTDTILVESWPACPDGCCMATRDPSVDVRTAANEVRPMFEVLVDRPGSTRPMVVLSSDFDVPGAVAL